MSNPTRLYDKIIKSFTHISIKILPRSVRELIKKIYTPYKILPCRFGESLIDPERLQFLLFLLQNQIYKKLDGDVIECGVFRGGSSIRMGLLLKDLKSDKKIHAIDTFEGFPFRSKEDPERMIQYNTVLSTTDYESVKQAVKKKGADNVILYKGECDKIFHSLNDKKFCFAHIDVDIYLSVKQCIEFLKDRMVEGGVIMFDEYNKPQAAGETKAVNELLGKGNIVPTGAIGGYWSKK